MAALSDFNKPATKPKLSDFFATGRAPSPLLNKASINNIAAYTAALGAPEQMAATYARVTDDLNYGTSAMVNDVVGQYDARDQAADYNSLVDIAADPSLSIEQRQSAITNFNAPGSGRIANSFFKRAAMAAAMADSEDDDNDETEFVRLDTTGVINDVDEYNGWVQKRINEIDNMSNPDALRSTKNIIELIIPFVEGGRTAAISGRFLSEDGNISVNAVAQSMTFLGQNKAAVRDALAALPLDQRKEVAENLINLIMSTNGPVSQSPNDIIMMDQLRSFLHAGAYGSEQQTLDNIFSLLDLTIVGGPLARGIKGVQRAGSIFAPSRVEAATLARYEAAVKGMEPEIAEVVAQVAPLSPVDEFIDNLPLLDNAPSDMIADVRKVLNDAMSGVEDVSIDDIIGKMRVLDNATNEQIVEVRQALTGVVGSRNRELDAMVNDDTIQATRDIIADKVISVIDEAPSAVYQDIRRVVDETIDGTSVGSKTISADLVARINDVLSNRNLTPIPDGKAAGNLKSYITNNVSESNVRRRYARTGTQPTSVSQAYVATNPAKARTAHEMVVRDKTGRAAEVLYGTNRTDAVGNDVLPEIGNADGSVRQKVSIDEAAPNPDQKLIREASEARGDIHYTANEKGSMRGAAKDTWRSIQGLVPRNEMSTISDTTRGVEFDVVYGPKDGGFSDPYQAIEQAKFGLRKYGVTDKNIEVLKFDGTAYVPVKEWKDKGNYLIRVKHDYEFSPADTVNWTFTSSHRLWRLFDAFTPFFSGQSGGLIQHLIPSTSVVDKLLLNAASVAADRTAWLAKRLLELGNDYAKRYKKLDATQKNMVEDYIIRANAKGLKFNSPALKAAGMTDAAIDTLRAWKKVQDTVYWFENQDLIKSLRARGFMHYVDQHNHTDLIVRPVNINQTGEVTKVFDGGKIRQIDRKDIRDLYERGGTLAKTRGAVEIDDDVFEYIMVDNSSATSYLRGITDDDTILNYRDGYYSVKYTDPYFITKEVKGKDGSVYTKTIATAENRKLAEQALARLRTTDEKGLYGLRGDLKRGTDAFNDSEWEAVVTRGRSSQRVRGERLGSFGETEDDLNKLHIETPEESLVSSIRSLANRVSHRDFIMAAKERFINQFGDLLPVEKGKPQWPTDVRAIGANDLEATRGRLADARSTWRYIQAIDNGYVNLLDDISKSFFKNFSDVAGRLGWGWLEKPTRAAERFGPTGWARKKAFRLLLAANPLRQLPVQAMQALPVVLATNPLAIPRIAAQNVLINYIARGGDVDSFMKVIARNATGLTAEEAKALAKNWELSGFEASVQANSLIRDDMKSLVNKGIGQKASAALGKPLDITQKVGFETGENLLMRTVWLSEYDKLRRSKKTINMEDLEQLNAKVRHLTLNMNRAGELPYNENALSAVMQFFQAPHKAFAQIVFGHRGLTRSERLRLGSMYVLTFGIGGTPVSGLIANALTPDTENTVLEILEGGVFNILLNKTLSTVFGVDVKADFSDSLRLLQFPNFFQFWKDISELQIGEALTASPSASLVFGDSPRITRFVKSLARPFTVNNGRQGEEFMNIGVEFLNIFSGASNFMKANYILQHQQQINSTGAIIDYESNYVEAMLKAGGFATLDEVKYYALNDKTYMASQAYKNDIDTVIRETSRRLANQGIDNTQAEYWIDMMAEAQRVWGNDPIILKEFMGQMERRAMAGEDDIFQRLLTLGGYVPESQMEDMLRDATQLDEEQKEILRGAFRILNESE